MSALPPKADMCGAKADVCFGPIADIRISVMITPAWRGLLRLAFGLLDLLLVDLLLGGRQRNQFDG
jgi:hypothetical protein